MTRGRASGRQSSAKECRSSLLRVDPLERIAAVAASSSPSNRYSNAGFGPRFQRRPPFAASLLPSQRGRYGPMIESSQMSALASAKFPQQRTGNLSSVSASLPASETTRASASLESLRCYAGTIAVMSARRKPSPRTGIAERFDSSVCGVPSRSDAPFRFERPYGPSCGAFQRVPNESDLLLSAPQDRDATTLVRRGAEAEVRPTTRPS